jgi:hypothetical protein
MCRYSYIKCIDIYSYIDSRWRSVRWLDAGCVVFEGLGFLLEQIYSLNKSLRIAFFSPIVK